LSSADEEEPKNQKKQRQKKDQQSPVQLSVQSHTEKEKVLRIRDKKRPKIVLTGYNYSPTNFNLIPREKFSTQFFLCGFSKTSLR